MKDLEGVKITFDKGALAAFSDGELKIIYVFSAITNRLQLVLTQSWGYWATAKDESRSEHARSAAIFGVFESLVLLAGVLKEAYQSIGDCYHDTLVAKSLNSKLPDFVQEALKRLPRHFAGTGITHYLRNNFSHHNDPESVLQLAKRLDKDAEHVCYFFPQDNKYFEFATKVRLFAIADYLKVHDWDEVIASLVNTVVKKVYPDVHVVLNGILAELFVKVPRQSEPAFEKDVRTFPELSGEYYLWLEQP